MYGEDANATKYFFEKNNNFGVTIVYRTLNTILRTLVSTFPINETTHIQAATLRNIDVAIENTLHICSYDDVCVINLFANGALVLSKTIALQTANQILYYLIGYTQMNHIDLQNCKVILSGFINEESALYLELYNFFIKIEFTKKSIFEFEENSFAPHFLIGLENIFL